MASYDGLDDIDAVVDSILGYGGCGGQASNARADKGSAPLTGYPQSRGGQPAATPGPASSSVSVSSAAPTHSTLRNFVAEPMGSSHTGYGDSLCSGRILSGGVAAGTHAAGRCGLGYGSSDDMNVSSEPSIDELVDRILAGEEGGPVRHVQQLTTSLSTSTPATPTPLQPQPRQLQQNQQQYRPLPRGGGGDGGSAHAGVEKHSTLAKRNGPVSASPNARARAAAGGSTSGAMDTHHVDPLLRRFALWEERKTVKKMKAVYEALLEEAAECTFRPNREPTALLPSKVVDAIVSGGNYSGRGGSTTISNDDARRGASLYGGDSVRGGAGITTRYSGTDRFQQPHTAAGGREDGEGRRISVATWNSLLAPSALYEGNKAWGYDEYLARMAVARYERERAQREEEETIRRHTDRAHFSRSPTRPDPFELSCYYRAPAVRSRATEGKGANASGSHQAKKASSLASGGSSKRHCTAQAKRGKAEGDVETIYMDAEEDEDNGVADRDSSTERSRAREGDAYYYSSQHATPSSLKRRTEMNTFATLGPLIREQLLFSEQTTEQLSRATGVVKQCFDDGLS